MCCSLWKEAHTYVTSANGRRLQRQRMVAHNVVDVPFVSAVVVRRSWRGEVKALSTPEAVARVACVVGVLLFENRFCL